LGESHAGEGLGEALRGSGIADDAASRLLTSASTAVLDALTLDLMLDADPPAPPVAAPVEKPAAKPVFPLAA